MVVILHCTDYIAGHSPRKQWHQYICTDNDTCHYMCVCLCLTLSYALPFLLLNFCQTSLESQSHDLASNYKLAGYWWLICVQLRRGGGHDDIWQVRTLRRSISNIGTELTRHDTTRSHQPRFLFVSVGLLSISYLDHSLVSQAGAGPGV